MGCTFLEFVLSFLQCKNRNANQNAFTLLLFCDAKNNNVKQTGQLLRTLNDHTRLVNSVAFSNLITYPIDIKLKECTQKKLNL
jgi:hypothetical protein